MIAFQWSHACSSVGLSQRRALSLAIPMALAFFPAWLQADSRECAALFTIGGSKGENVSDARAASSVATTVEGAFVNAWVELLSEGQGFGSSGVQSWVVESFGRESSVQVLDGLTNPPPGVVSLAVSEGLLQLSNWISTSIDEGRLDSESFVVSLRDEASRHVELVRQADAVKTTVTEARENFRMSYQRFRMGGTIESSPLVLPRDPGGNGADLVAVSRSGDVVFLKVDDHGNGSVLRHGRIQGGAAGTPFRLGGGKIVVPNSFDHGLVFQADGTQVGTVELTDMEPETSPLLLDDGSVLLAGTAPPPPNPGRYRATAEFVVVNADGKKTRKWTVPANHFETQPLRLKNGEILVAGGGGGLHFLSGKGESQRVMPTVGGVSHDPAQLEDGTIVVVTGRECVEFYEADGRPKSSWLFFQKKIDLGEIVAVGPIALPGSRVAVITGKGLFSIFSSSGKVLLQTRIPMLAGTEHLVLEDGSIIVTLGHPADEEGIKDYLKIRPDGSTKMLSRRPDEILSARMALVGRDGLEGNALIATGTSRGELVLLTTDLEWVSRVKIGTVPRMKTLLLPGGGGEGGLFVAGGDSGSLLLLDEQAVLEGLALDLDL